MNYNYFILAGVIFVSLFGIFFLIFQKLPKLSELKEADNSNFLKTISALKHRLIKKTGMKFSAEIILQKIISQIRILSLKTDNKTFDWLQKLKEKTRQSRLESKRYWDEITASSPKEGKQAGRRTIKPK